MPFEPLSDDPDDPDELSDEVEVDGELELPPVLGVELPVLGAELPLLELLLLELLLLALP